MALRFNPPRNLIKNHEKIIYIKITFSIYVKTNGFIKQRKKSTLLLRKETSEIDKKYYIYD